MDKVLVDTSIWIDFLRRAASKEEINDLNQKGLLATCGVVKAEFLPFISKNEDYWKDFFDKMFFISFKDEWWDDAIGFQEMILERKLPRFTIPDLVILTLCLKTKSVLFTKDQAFYRVQDIFKFHLFDASS